MVKTYTEILKELRKENKISQTEIANALGCRQTTYSQYELKKRDTPTEVLCKLADYYGTSTDYLLGRTDKRKPYPKLKQD